MMTQMTNRTTIRSSAYSFQQQMNHQNLKFTGNWWNTQTATDAEICLYHDVISSYQNPSFSFHRSVLVSLFIWGKTIEYENWSALHFFVTIILITWTSPFYCNVRLLAFRYMVTFCHSNTYEFLGYCIVRLAIVTTEIEVALSRRYAKWW